LGDSPLGSGFCRPDADEGDFLALASLLDPLIQRLQHTRIHGGNHINSRIELFFGHPCFPCVRKATVHSGIAKAHHRDGQTDEHLFPFGETLDGVSVTIESSKIGFLQGLAPFV
jgi:hypothetical protein